MTPRSLALGWVVLCLAVLVALGYGLGQWRALTAESTRAADERRRLADEIRLRRAQLVAEMRARGGWLREMQASGPGADPSTFLMRLADLAGERRAKITTVGPLERQATPQFTKSWHVIQVVGPYRDVRELIARVEREKGIVEDVKIEPAPAPGRPEGMAPDEVQARFRLTALELSPQAKAVFDRVLASDGNAAAGLPLVPPRELTDTAPARDPFAFAARRAAEAPKNPPTPPPPPPVSPPAPMELSAIVGFPGGYLAIINNQIVKAGDVVNGARIERITETSVSLREPDAPPRTIELPQLGAPPPAAPRR